MENVNKSLHRLQNNPNFQDRYIHAKQEVLNHPKVQAFFQEHTGQISGDMVDRSLMKLKEYIEQSTNCEGCESLESCKNITPGLFPQLVIKEKMIDTKYTVCKKKQAADERREQLKLIQSLHIPKDILKITMEDVSLEEGRLEAVRLAMQFILDYEAGTYQKGLYLHGSFGIGKTYILGAIANELALRKIPSMIVYVPEFFRELKSSIQNNTLEEKLDAVKTAPVLMLDDFGAESLTSWVRDDIISPLLQYRMQENLPTFFTSNFNLQELTHHLAHTQRGEVEQVKANRIMERIKYLATPVKLDGKNWRG